MLSKRTTVALSGSVGSGKSTAAKAIVEALRSAGCPAAHVRFRDFARVGIRRQSGTDRGGDDANTRWQYYRRRRLTTGIAVAFAFRTILFRLRLRRWPVDTVLVFDRYFYDTLVHFELDGAVHRTVRLFMNTIPPPTVGALLLVNEKTVSERRPRYSADYVREVTRGYEQLAHRLPGMVVARTDEFTCVRAVAHQIASYVLTNRRPGMEERR